MGDMTNYNREQILYETLNKKAREIGFFNWEEMSLSIPKFQKIFIEGCIREALLKINWQGTLD